MKEISIWNYIQVGTCLRFLEDQKVGFPVKAESYCLQNIKSFLGSLDELGLHVTNRASHKLKAIQKELEVKSDDSKLTQDEAKRISDTAWEIRATFTAETLGVFTYVVTDKRIEVKKLLDGVAQLFSPDSFVTCSEIAQYDFSEAGKCIAFERPTAAAFHILRGTESVLRQYYKRFIRPAQNGLTWGQITHALAAKTTGKKPDPNVLQILDHIRINFRNPTQHPDKVYDIHEVQDLFSLCIDAVNRMTKVIKA